MGSTRVLILGVVLGLIAAGLAFTQVKEEEEVPVVGQEFMKLSSDTNLAAGDRLSPDMVSAVTIPLEFDEVKSVAVAYTPDVQAWLENNEVRVSRDILAGSFILHEHLLDDPEVRFANIISESGRAISIPVSEITAVGYFIEPGSRVDVLTTLSYDSPESLGQNSGLATDAGNGENQAGTPVGFTGLEKKRTVTKTLLQNMQVLAVGQSTTRNAYLNNRRGYSSITLDVTPEQAELLTFIMAEASKGFTFLLRNPVNTSEQDIEEVDWQTVTNQ